MFAITSQFIASVDLLALGTTAVDDILPYLRDLLNSLNKYPDMPENYEGTGKVKIWSEKLDQMKATDNLSEDDVRQLKLDLDSACQQFKDVVCS